MYLLDTKKIFKNVHLLHNNAPAHTINIAQVAISDDNKPITTNIIYSIT